MPAQYAHYRFGKLLLPTLPSDVRQCIQRFRRMYDVGLQGPDPFFYYNPFWTTAPGQLGHTFHAQSGREFFTAACVAADSEAAMAYLYGLLGHYCLDSLVHPYIQQLVDIGEANHVALEFDFERALLAADGNPSPATYDIGKRLKLTRGECMTAAAMYPGATGGNVSRSLKVMGIARKILASSNRAGWEKLLKRIDPSLCDHFIPAEENPDYTLYLRELKGLYQQAMENYPILLAQLQALKQKEIPLGADFDPTFG